MGRRCGQQHTAWWHALARTQASAQEDSDDVEQAKALDKVKALEDRMVLEAAIEEEFGDATRGDGASTASDGKAVWEWLTDLSSTDAQGLEAPRKVGETTLQDSRPWVPAPAARLADLGARESSTRSFVRMALMLARVTRDHDRA